MVIKNIDFEKYNKLADKTFYRKLGKVVNVVGLTIESAGPDSKLGDLSGILPETEGAKPIMAEVDGFRDKKTLLMPYDSVDGIGLGCVVENTGDPLTVTVSEKLLGKTVNGLESPLMETRLQACISGRGGTAGPYVQSDYRPGITPGGKGSGRYDHGW